MAGTRDALDSMPPWDAAAYFETPKMDTFAQNLAGTYSLISADPNRIALIISNDSGATVFLRTRRTPTGSFGIALPTADPTHTMLFSETGPLCQQEWLVTIPGTSSLTIFSVTLSRWPVVAVPNGRVKRAQSPKRK